MKKVVIYARVSTAGQDYERQLSELKEYASRMNYEVVEVFAEKISGAKGYEMVYARNKKFTKSKKTVRFTGIAKTVKGLKKGKTYYIKRGIK